MMDDKELLHLAAKAHGLNIKAISINQDDNFDGLIVGSKNTKNKTKWNPLNSDADALHLAVKLRFEVSISDELKSTTVWFLEVNECTELFLSDPYAATRRAIVRAAAEIGKSIKNNGTNDAKS
jgi:hypothetical protein